MRSVPRLALTLVCLSLLGIARADNGEQKSGGQKSDETRSHRIAKNVLAAAKIDLAKAIETAQAKVPAGKPIYAQAEENASKTRFEVFLLVGDEVTEVKVDAVTGEIAEVEEDEGDDIGNLSEAEQVLKVSKITFAQAIAKATAVPERGKPFEIEAEMVDAQSIIKVSLLAGNKVVAVLIDAVTGKLLEVESE